MTTYSTTEPITATIQLAHGDVRIEADDRQDVVVDVAPTLSTHQPDVDAAEQTRVEFADGVLRITGAKGRGVAMLRKPGSVQIIVNVPTGSNLVAETGLGRITTKGLLGACRVRSGAGDVLLQDAGSLDVVTGFGGISAGHVAGDASCVTGSGGVRIAQVDGSMTVRNSNGETWLGAVGNAVKVKASNGSVVVDRAQGDVKVATANGDLRVGSAEGGILDLRTAMGRIEVGVPEGTAARLDVHTSFGAVVNELEPTDRPQPDEAIVTMSARTSAGDIVIHRAPADA